jgi:hypothetical protein
MLQLQKVTLVHHVAGTRLLYCISTYMRHERIFTEPVNQQDIRVPQKADESINNKDDQ